MSGHQSRLRRCCGGTARAGGPSLTGRAHTVPHSVAEVRVSWASPSPRRACRTYPTRRVSRTPRWRRRTCRATTTPQADAPTQSARDLPRKARWPCRRSTTPRATPRRTCCIGWDGSTCRRSSPRRRTGATAIKRSRPPQRGHASTSVAHARRIRSAHDAPRFAGRGVTPHSGSSTRGSAVAPARPRGTTSARHAARGASTP